MREPCPRGTRALAAHWVPSRLPFGPRVGFAPVKRLVGPERGGRKPGGEPAPQLTPGLRGQFAPASAPQLPSSWSLAGAAITKWAGLVAEEGRAQSDDLLEFLLLPDSQDSGVQDLQPSPKQLMEAPLQTGMVRVEG